MGRVREYVRSWEHRPWHRASCQGLACAAGIAVAGLVAGWSWEVVVAGAAIAGLLIAVGLGALLRIQGVGRGRTRSGRAR